MTRTPAIRRWLAALVAVAFAFAGAIAVPLAAQASPVASVITGSVADPASVNTGDTVELWEFPAGASSFGFLTNTAIDGTGSFSFSIVINSDASYAVVIDTTAPGYEPTWSDNTVFGPELTTDPGSLPGGPTVDFGVITMAAEITVSGTITDANGPVDNVVVLLLRVGDSSPVSAALTDVNGDYHIPFVTNTRALIGAEVPLGGPTTGYAMQFWSGKPSPGTGQSILTAGAPGDDMPGHDFSLLATADTINILSTYTLTGVGCGCSGFPQTVVHLYMKSGDYWTPIATDGDLGSLLSGFVEFTPGDYRLRFTDPSGGWLPVDAVFDTNPGIYGTSPTPDGCAVELDGLALGDQPTLDVDLDVASASCGDEPAPPPPPIAPIVVVKRHSTVATLPDVTATPAPTPTPTPTATEPPTPEPTVTTQTPSHPATPASANLAWIWWLVGIVVLVLVLAGLGVFFFRRRV
jgi:hypothetical protein